MATPFIRKACEQFDVTLLAKPFALDLRARFWPSSVRIIPFNAPWTAFTFKDKYYLPRWPWRTLASAWRFLYREKFDVAISARWDPRDHFLLYMTGARARLGFPRMGSKVFLTHPLYSKDRLAHRYNNWRIIAQSLKLDLDPSNALVFPRDRHSRQILIHTGAAQSVRVWPLEKYRVIIQKLRESGHEVKVACNPDQVAFWKNAGEKDYCCPSNISELIGALDDSGVFIGNDSGPGHLAAVCGLPTFTFFGPQVAEWFVPLHPAAEYMEGRPCPFKPCSDYCRFPTPHCMTETSLDEAWTRVNRFVERNLHRQLALK